MEKLHTLGTVVKISNSVQEYTIVGYYPKNNENVETYTYIGINAAYGFSVVNSAVLFNEDRIEKVIFKGYEDEKGEEFREWLKSTEETWLK